MNESTELQLLLDRARSGDQSAMAAVFEGVYEQLRAMAGSRMKSERGDHTLQPTALVHEAYARLMGGDIPWSNRAQFFGAAAQAMRRVLIDHARARACHRRGGDRKRAPRRIPFDAIELTAETDPEELLAVDEAISRLEATDAELGQLVRLRFFAGLSEAHAAEAMGLSLRSAQRSWSLAKAWLRRSLAEGAPP